MYFLQVSRTSYMDLEPGQMFTWKPSFHTCFYLPVKHTKQTMGKGKNVCGEGGEGVGGGSQYCMQSTACLLILRVICHYVEVALHLFPLREPEFSYANPYTWVNVVRLHIKAFQEKAKICALESRQFLCLCRNLMDTTSHRTACPSKRLNY